MFEKYKITNDKAIHILRTREEMIRTLSFGNEFMVVLYEEPEGSPRPRARYVNRSNLARSAKSYPGFIQVYSITGASDRKFMKRLIEDNEFMQMDRLIYTPCSIEFDAFFKTPASFNSIDTYLAELGCIRPICKPDFDNIEKKYSDMYNGNIWLDDSLVVDGIVRKYYSILPRVEIHLRYLNMLYNKYQYNSMVKRVEEGSNVDYFNTSMKRN